jgi:hypothetical protein
MSGRPPRGGVRTATLTLSLAAALALVAAPVRAASPVRVETIVRPDTVLVGQTVTITWRVWLPKGSTLSFPARPADDSLAHWASWTVGTIAGKSGVDEHRLTAALQSFALGPVALPGPSIRFHVTGEDERRGRFPTSGFVVGRTVEASGPEPPLRGMKALLTAPWWQRVPWLIVLAALAAALVLVFVVRALLLRTRPGPAAPEALVPDEPAEIVARRRLAALVASRLPEEGRTYEHGTELADILRRYVERRFEIPRPGLTTRELMTQLAARAEVAPDARARLLEILEACDLTKFARRPYDVDRAHAAEREAAALVDAWIAP